MVSADASVGAFVTVEDLLVCDATLPVFMSLEDLLGVFDAALPVFSSFVYQKLVFLHLMNWVFLHLLKFG